MPPPEGVAVARMPSMLSFHSWQTVALIATDRHTAAAPATESVLWSDGAVFGENPPAAANALIDAAVQKAREEEQQRSKAEMDDFFSKAGLKNTITGEPIRNIEEFRSWKESYDAAKLQEDLKAGRLTPESLDAAIQKSPAVQKAEEILRRSEEAERAAEEAKAQAEINEQISEIGKLDPSIKTVRDLLTMPKAKEFYEYVKRGNNYLDAYYLATRGEREAKMAEAGRQQALANARSKDHLTASGTGRSDAQPSVSAEDMAMFRLFNPDCTEAQVQAYMKKKTGG